MTIAEYRERLDRFRRDIQTATLANDWLRVADLKNEMWKFRDNPGEPIEKDSIDLEQERVQQSLLDDESR
jgi:hypothetical protein